MKTLAAKSEPVAVHRGLRIFETCDGRFTCFDPMKRKPFPVSYSLANMLARLDETLDARGVESYTK